MQVCLESPKNYFQTYRPKNDPGPSSFVVGSVLMGKELAELKRAIFKNWLKIQLGKGSKNPITAFVRDGGGYPPLP